SLYNYDYKQRLRAQFGLNVDDYIYIFIGRLVHDKGVTELVNAFRQKKSIDRGDERTNIKLLLVGNYEQDLDPLSRNTLLHIENDKNILAVGFQSDVRPYLAISNALVFPSYREGFPNVVMQAGAMGLPAIVSDINGCNEIIV